MVWIVYGISILAVSGLIGRHLGKFGDTCTEMIGMMTGMTMGMLNGFVLGFAAAAATGSMFWGNALGITLGLTLGGWFGRGGALMGVMDGAMGGVMGGSMGAMLAVMVQFPEWGVGATAVLLAALYIAGMIALVVLIEQRAPQHAAQHRLAPLFARRAVPRTTTVGPAPAQAAGLVNYYEMLDIPVRAATATVAQAYSAYIADADSAARTLADQALATLSNPALRSRYDRELTLAAGRGECCPPPRRTAGGSLPLAALLALIMTGVLVLSGCDATPAATGNKATPALAQVGADGTQVLDMTVNGDTMSYQPESYQVRVGVPVRVTLRVVGRDPGCGRFVGLRDLGEHGIATPGEVTHFEFTPQKLGSFEINCSMHMMKPGQLIVTGQ